MKNSFKTTPKGFIYSLLVSFVLMVMIGLSCEKQAKFLSPGKEVDPSSTRLNTPAAKSISTTMTRQQALARINALFKDELNSINSDQVQGVNKQQFTSWLRNSKIAQAEQKYFGPLLSANVTEFVLLHKVTFRITGKKATIALVSVPAELHSRYTKLVVLTDLTDFNPGKLCSWFYCDYLDPNMCLCLYTTGMVPVNSACPASECDPLGAPCQSRSGGPCNDPLFDQVIAAW